MSDKVRIGIAGTSWWADAMYLPAIATHPLADIRGIAGGTRPAHTRAFAEKWGIPHAYDSVTALLDAEPLDALLVLTPNKAHYATTMAALERGLAVLCEKPLGMTSREAREMTEAAATAGVTTMTPFTYRFMPANRYLKELVDQGWIGRPYHLNMRYYTGYGRSGEYAWRFDVGEAGSGIAGDIGSHWVYLARWYFGEIRAVTAVYTHLVPRGPRPDGAPYEVAEDTAILVLEFENGATGSLHMTSLAHEPGTFGQRHEIDLHGSGGTLRAMSDWRTIQRVEGARADDTEPRELPIPEHIWAGARHDTVHNTYRDVFRTQESMTRAFVTAVAERRMTSPDFADGLAVQQVLAAADRSAQAGRRVEIEEIRADGG
ncbi:MAG: Gfo/Idh/MocA family oxidoreductase [Chloroflexota bacterium]